MLRNKSKAQMETVNMLQKLGAAALLTLVMALPSQQAAAQDVLGGALLGGAAGALIGGAVTGKGGGAAIGAVIGATTGAMIAAEGERRRSGYYYWHRGCYLQRSDRAWVRVSPRYCGAEVYYEAPAAMDDDIAYCARRYRSYDPVSQTYMGYDGLRHPCPE